MTVPAAHVVASLPPDTAAADRRSAALQAWLDEARRLGVDAHPVEEAPADHSGRDQSMTEAGDAPPPDPWVADVEADGERLRLELRDHEAKVVVGWLR